MRIIAGQAKGKRIEIPHSLTARPTTDHVKEAFFNIIGPVEGKSFLDLYAGSGNMALEALSRRAIKAVVVENNRTIINALCRNIKACGFEGKCVVIELDFMRAVKELVKKSEVFHILFADPPYEQGCVSQTLLRLQEVPLMERGGILAIQHSVREPAEVDEKGQLVLIDRRRYGDTILSFFEERD